MEGDEIRIINPNNGAELRYEDDCLVDGDSCVFPVIDGIPRIADLNNYTANFGMQWNKFDKTQFDIVDDGITLSYDRFFKVSGWKIDDLIGKNLLEVGSGAGRFSRVVLENTRANLYSVDYSNSVTANYNNNWNIAPNRFHLFQASIYEMPFPDNSFDKVFCFGVLQHTPDFERSIRSLVSKVKSGGEVVVDFYPMNGWWTKIHAKYLFRVLTKRISHENLLKMIESNVDWLIYVSRFLNKNGLKVLARFLPLVDIETIPSSKLSENEFREWVVLDTFDMFSPVYDNPQSIQVVTDMFRSCDMEIKFAGFVEYSGGSRAAVIRAIKP